jgi:hypothetical protein
MNARSLCQTLFAAAAAALLLAAGCSDDEGLAPAPADAAAPASAGLAVVNSDHRSTAISLLDPAGRTITKDPCLHSGSQAPMLSAALSGDVVLPSQPQPGGELTIIDRMNGTLTWVNAAGCAVLRQMSTGAFPSNPQDVVGDLPGGRAYVTRYGSNPAKTEEGNDVLIIDAKAGKALGTIDLRASASTVAGKTILPGPTRALKLGNDVYVALNNLSDDFMDAGAGRVVVIDASTDKVKGTIELPALKNCGGLAEASGPGGARALVVACGGPFSDGDKQIDSSGVAWVELDMTPPRVTVVPAKGFGRPVSGFGAAVVSQERAFIVVNGGGMVKDAVWSFDFKGGAPQVQYQAGAAYALSIFLDRKNGSLYVLDATAADPKLVIYAAAGSAAPMKTGELKSSPATGLPPQQIGWY